MHAMAMKKHESAPAQKWFGRYELLQRIGTGGMAEVFLGREPLPGGLSKLLVIKKIHGALARTPAFQRMFEEEARIAVNLNHPCLVQTFNYGKLDETLFLAMEYVEGLDLLRLLQLSRAARRPLPRGLGAFLMAQVCKGLDYAHRRCDERGEALWIVHRDVSPQNVLLSWDGAVKLADFGIARNRDTQEDDGVLKGKYAYMSPEQALGQPVDHRSDVFSAGVVLFEAVTGRTLFSGLPPHQALAEISAGRIPHPREVDPGMPAELAAILLRALQPRREERYQTARDLQNDLSRFYFAHAQGEVIDSGRLAAYLAGLVPKGERLEAPSAGHGSLVGVGAVPTGPGGSASVHEQHNVVLIEGTLFGLSLVQRLLGEEAARELLLGFQRTTENLAYKHRAHVDRLDERGFTCVIGIRREDEQDGLRAIRLALAELEALEALMQDQSAALQLGIGVQRGLILLRRRWPEAGAAETLGYEILGTTLELARRLSRNARPGEVMVGGSIYRATRGAWRFEPVAPVELPAGLPSSEGPRKTPTHARAYRLLGRRLSGERPSQPPRLWGRQDELGRLHQALADAREHRAPRHLLWMGDVGLGKKTLLAAFRASLDSATHLVLHATAGDEHREEPFALLAGLARDVLGLSETADPVETRLHLDAAVRLLGEDPLARSQVEALLGALELLLCGQAARGTGRQQDYLTAMAQLLGSLCGDRTLVLSIAELQWADAASLAVLDVLEKRRWQHRAVLFVATLRGREDWPDPPGHSKWLAQRMGSIVALPGLSPADQQAWVLSRFAPGPDRDEALPLCQQIVEKAGGNPLYLSEILDALVERRILRPAPGGEGLCWADKDQAITVPTHVAAMVAARLDRLPEAERQCLLVLALWHDEAARLDPRLLADLLGRPAEADLDALRRRGLVSRLADGSHRVTSSIVGDVARAAVPEEERRALKLRLAKMLPVDSQPSFASTRSS